MPKKKKVYGFFHQKKPKFHLMIFFLLKSCERLMLMTYIIPHVWNDHLHYGLEKFKNIAQNCTIFFEILSQFLVKNIPSLCQNKTCVPQTLSQSRILVFTQYDTKELVYIFKKNRDIVAEDYTLWYFLQPFYILMCFVYFIIHIYSTYLFIVSYLLTVIVCVGKSYFC